MSVVKNRDGFSIIEVLLSASMLIVISFATSSLIVQAQKSNQVVNAQIDVASVRTTLNQVFSGADTCANVFSSTQVPLPPDVPNIPISTNISGFGPIASGLPIPGQPLIRMRDVELRNIRFLDVANTVFQAQFHMGFESATPSLTVSNVRVAVVLYFAVDTSRRVNRCGFSSGTVTDLPVSINCKKAITTAWIGHFFIAPNYSGFQPGDRVVGVNSSWSTDFAQFTPQDCTDGVLPTGDYIASIRTIATCSMGGFTGAISAGETAPTSLFQNVPLDKITGPGFMISFSNYSGNRVACESLPGGIQGEASVVFNRKF